MSKKRIAVHLIVGLVLGLTSSTWAIDFGVLDKWRGACAQSGGAAPGCGNKGESSGSNWHGFVQDVNTASAINDSAARDLEYFASILGTLDDYSRAVLASELTDSERKSVNSAYQAVTRRFQDALALNRSLHAKIGALESERARLQSRLLELESDKNAVLAEIVNVKADIAGLRMQIVRTKERLAWAEQDADTAKSLASSAALSARAARTSYWSVARAYFDQNKLGLPRDFIPEVGTASAYAERRRVVNGSPVTVPFALQTIPIAARAAIVPASVAAQAAAPLQIDREAFLRLMGQWRTTLDNTRDLQIQAGNLASAAQDSAHLIDQKAAQVADLQVPLDEGRREENGLRVEAAGLQVKLERTLANGQASLGEFFNSSKEMLVWQLAEESLKLGLSPVASAATYISMVGAIGRSYNTLFENDIPALISLMGQNPSDDAIEKYESLMHLESQYGKDILASTFFAGLSEMPEFNEASKLSEEAKEAKVWLADEIPERNTRLKLNEITIGDIKTRKDIKIYGLELPSGMKLSSFDAKFVDSKLIKPEFDPQMDLYTQLEKVYSHTAYGADARIRTEELFAHDLGLRVEIGKPDHSVFDVPPDRTMDFVENLSKRIETKEGVLDIRLEENPRNRTYVLIEMKNFIGRTGVDWKSPNSESTGVSTKRVLVILNSMKDRLINIYPVPITFKLGDL